MASAGVSGRRWLEGCRATPAGRYPGQREGSRPDRHLRRSPARAAAAGIQRRLPVQVRRARGLGTQILVTAVHASRRVLPDGRGRRAGMGCCGRVPAWAASTRTAANTSAGQSAAIRTFGIPAGRWPVRPASSGRLLQGCRKSVELSSVRKVLVVCHPGSAADLTVVVVVPLGRAQRRSTDDLQGDRLTTSAMTGCRS